MPVNLLSPSDAERLPIRPYSGHCGAALSFFALDEIYFGVGRVTPWPNDENGNSELQEGFIAPEPDVNAKTIDELVGLKRTSRKTLVYPDPAGDIEYRNSTWRSISEQDAINLSARWVLIESQILYSELPLIAYRQIGVFSRVEKQASVPPSREVLLPADIVDVGILEVLDNRKAVTRQADTKDVFQMIIEF